MAQINNSKKWMGVLPDDWSIASIKHLFNVDRGRVISAYDLAKDGKFPVYSSQTENNGCFGYLKTYDFKGPALTWTTDGAKAGTVFLRKGNFNCTNVCGILQPKKFYLPKININFFYYMVSCAAQNNRRKDMIGYKIMSNEMENIKIAFPPLSEQQKIASFLDEKTKEIDKAIEKAKETIELYKKYKQSIIYKTVCEGIDNNHLKNTSSKYWVKIPIEWQMVKVKRIFEIVKRIAGEEGYTILSITQKGIKEKDISHNEGQVAADYSNYQFVYPGDFAMNHMDLLTGWVDISKYFGVTSPDYRVFRLKDSFQHDNRYWLYVMQTCYMNKIFYSLARGVSTLGRWRLQAESFNNFEVPVPTLEEQKQIADYLDDKISSIDGLINYKEKFITQLENYKKSLIYEYVTGKKEI